MKPTVLIATTTRWIPTARLAVALANAGFIIDAVCSSKHPLANTDAIRQTYSYRGLDPLTSFADAISAAKPDLIVPGDDRAAQHLHLLYDQERRKGDAGKPICALIERSLGAPENFPVLYARTKFIQLAHEQGVRVPKTEIISDHADLKKWIAQTDLPMVLKADGSSGGDGVRIAAPSKTPSAPCALCKLLLSSRALSNEPWSIKTEHSFGPRCFVAVLSSTRKPL